MVVAFIVDHCVKATVLFCSIRRLKFRENGQKSPHSIFATSPRAVVAFKIAYRQVTIEKRKKSVNIGSIWSRVKA